MNRRKLTIDDFAVESFEAGIDPMSPGEGGCSGNGCTVLTTCGPNSCDNTADAR